MSATENRNPAFSRESLINQGLMLHKAGLCDLALNYYIQAFLYAPNYALLNNLMGMIARHKKEFSKAKFYFSRAVKLEPDNHEFLYNLALIHYELGYYGSTYHLLINAIKLEPNRADYFYYLGKTFLKIFKNQKAKGAFFAALKIDKVHQRSWLSLGKLFKNEYKYKEARKCFEAVLKINPNHIRSICNLSNLDFSQPNNNSLLRINKLIQEQKRDTKDLVKLLFAKGAFYHLLQDYNSAFEVFNQANAVHKKHHESYNGKIYEDYLSNIKQIQKCKLEVKEVQGFRPCFVLGPSMSGKSLIEQLITNSSNIVAGYENKIVHTVTTQLTRHVDKFENTTEHRIYLEQIRHFYIKLHKTVFNGAQLTTSTRPNDIFLLMPFLQGIPEMRLIACYRNPYDVAIKMYMRDYEEGNNYNTDLSNCLHYVYHYQQTMNVLHELFPKQVLKVTYEDVVSQQNNFLASINKFLEIEIDPVPAFDMHVDQVNIWRNYKCAFVELGLEPQNRQILMKINDLI